MTILRTLASTSLPLPLLLLLLLVFAPLLQPSLASGAFSILEWLPEGELQRTIRFEGLCAREVLVNWGNTYLTLREIWMDEANLKLNLIYQEDILTDCFEDTWGMSSQHEKNVCTSMPQWVDHVAEHSMNFKVRSYINDTVAHKVIAKEFPWLLDSLAETRRCCAIAQGSTAASKMSRMSRGSRGSRSRPKRGIRELVIAPGTKWCGPHRLAYNYRDLGALDGLDRCCRRHDHCPRAIAPFSEKYGLFNYMPFTLSHCGCDERFRTCLKMTGTSSANLIGKIFFNMFQTKCFVLKPSKICVKRSWWGKCEKHEYKKQGYLRDNVSY